MRTPKSMDVNDIDTEALFSQSPSYMGEAQIDEKTFEPRGIEVPTQIFNSAEEAIQLENFPVEVRKYIKRIFLERPFFQELHLEESDPSSELIKN